MGEILQPATPAAASMPTSSCLCTYTTVTNAQGTFPCNSSMQKQSPFRKKEKKKNSRLKPEGRMCWCTIGTANCAHLPENEQFETCFVPVGMLAIIFYFVSTWAKWAKLPAPRLASSAALSPPFQAEPVPPPH